MAGCEIEVSLSPPPDRRRTAQDLPKTPEYLADRGLVEDFARLVVDSFGERCLAVVLLPWTSAAPPSGVVCPTDGKGTLNATQLQAALHSKTVIVVGCTFQFKEEEDVAAKVLDQLAGFHGVFLLGALVLPPGDNFQPQNFDKLMEVHERITNLGVHDVLMDPDPEPTQLKLRIRMAQHSWSVQQEHLQAMLSEEPPSPPAEEVEALEAKRQQLLWVDLPRELMPRLKRMAEGLCEREDKVGEYSLISRMPSHCGCVWEGRNGCNKKVIIKITKKSDVFTPWEVEGIYREYSFLALFTKHPNITRALDCFHSPKAVYTVLEFAGERNLASHLSNLPGLRMSADESTQCFVQVARALAHCHKKGYSHRSISLEHIVMNAETSVSPSVKLVDFRSMVKCSEDATSVAMCGYLPCMSPEVLTGRPYLPVQADCWSAGVVLLEMAGGKGSFFRAVQINEEEASRTFDGDSADGEALAERIHMYYQIPGNHAAALACMGGIQSDGILDILEHVLQLEGNRATMDQFTYDEEPPAEDEISQKESALT